MINPSKSCFITAPSLPEGKIRNISNRLGNGQKELPLIYLGCPLYIGRKTKKLFDPLILKLQGKVGSWMGNLLNSARRVTFVNHVLHSITTYQIASLDPLVLVAKAIEKLFANFFWGQVEAKRKAHSIS